MNKNVRRLCHFLTAIAVTSTFSAVSILPDHQPVVSIGQPANAQTACDPVIRDVRFTGKTSGSQTRKPDVVTNVRSNTTRQAPIVVTIPANTTVTFSGWAYGDPENDIWTGNADHRWFRVTYGGRTGWVASAVIWGNPPNAPLAPNCSGARLPWRDGVTAPVSQGVHTDGYGLRSFDIALPAGTPVLAPADVTVVSSCLANRATNHRAMKLRDSAGRFYSLIHVSATDAAVAVGKTYRRGAQIGVVASDRNLNTACAVSRGVHLHMGLPSLPFSIGGYTLTTSTRVETQLTAR